MVKIEVATNTHKATDTHKDIGIGNICALIANYLINRRVDNSLVMVVSEDPQYIANGIKKYFKTVFNVGLTIGTVRYIPPTDVLPGCAGEIELPTPWYHLKDKNILLLGETPEELEVAKDALIYNSNAETIDKFVLN